MLKARIREEKHLKILCYISVWTPPPPDRQYYNGKRDKWFEFLNSFMLLYILFNFYSTGKSL